MVERTQYTFEAPHPDIVEGLESGRTIGAIVTDLATSQSERAFIELEPGLVWENGQVKLDPTHEVWDEPRGGKPTILKRFLGRFGIAS